MKMINCSKETYLNALGSAWDRGTKEDRAKLRGLCPHGLFNYTEHGRDIALCTWLMVLRADMRGKLALPKLAVQEFEAAQGLQAFTTVEVNGQQVKKRQRPNAEARAVALTQQHALITRMMEACPSFFAGLIEEDKPKEVAAE
jgi:hypothetical protein